MKGVDTFLPKRGPEAEPHTMLANPIMASMAFAMSKGVDLQRLTDATGISFSDLMDPNFRPPETTMPKIWNLLAETFPHENMPLEMAESAPLSFFGDFVETSKYAGDIRGAIDIFLRFQRILSTQVQLKTREEGGIFTLEMHHPLDELDGGLSAVVGLAMTVRLGREVLGIGEALRGVELMANPPQGQDAYLAFFGCPVKFAQPRNALRFQAIAEGRLPQKMDPERFRLARNRLELVHKDLEARDEPLELQRLKDGIAQAASEGDYSVQGVARALGVGIRTLQRRAEALDTSLRTLVAEMREAHAKALLVDSEWTMTEIAYVLGYSNVPAFHRAFRRWTGQNPGAYRRGARA